MKVIRQIGSLAFVLGLFVTIFAGVPWHVITSDDPVVPVWLCTAIFCLLGGILVVLVSLAIEQWQGKQAGQQSLGPKEVDPSMLLLNSDAVPGRVRPVRCWGWRRGIPCSPSGLARICRPSSG